MRTRRGTKWGAEVVDEPIFCCLLAEPKNPGRGDQRFYKGEWLRGGVQLKVVISTVTEEVAPPPRTDSGPGVARATRTTTKTQLGTIGCLARTIARPGEPSQIVALTNQHVLSENDRKQLRRAVGQPDTADSFCSPCSSHVFGRVYDALLTEEVDGAIVVLHPDRFYRRSKYKNEVQGIGRVEGPIPAPLTEQDIAGNGYVVQKRGRTSWHTMGVVVRVNGDRHQVSSPEDPNRVVRFARGHTVVSACPPFTAFASQGDSGSVVMNRQNQVVGLLFGSGGLQASADPIHTVLDKLRIELLPNGPGTDPILVPDTNDSSRTPRPDVPATQEPRSADDADAPALSLLEPSASADNGRPDDAEAQLLVEAEHRLMETPRGREYSQVFQQHIEEILHLIERNRRVTVAWHRGGGPTILNQAFRCLKQPDLPFPEVIHDLPAAKAVDRILATFRDHGSLALRQDIDTYGGFVGQLGGRTFEDVLHELRQ